MASQTLTIRRPDDWHVHLRDGEMLKTVAPYTARQFARAIVMPNLVPPITTAEAAIAYRERIVAAAGPGFTPLMTCYLTDDANPDEIAHGFEDGAWIAAKLYPAGATTNSASGVTDIRKHLSGARADGEDRHGALRPRRSRRSASRRVRPRGGVHRARPFEAGQGLSRPQDRVRAHHHQGRRRVRQSIPKGGSDNHTAPSPHQSERFVRRWTQAARLLPPCRQAGGTSPGSAQGRDLGFAQILPRYGQRPARARGQGIQPAAARASSTRLTPSKAM